MNEYEEYLKKRGDSYRLAFWCLVRKLCIGDFSFTLDELAICCKVCEMNEEQTRKILDETTDAYLKQKGY